jgi:hypothetical protein
MDYTFITVLDPEEAGAKRQHQQARTHAIRNAVQRKRRRMQQTQKNFIQHRVPGVQSPPLETRHASPQTLVPPIWGSWHPSLDTIDPFDSLAVHTRRLTTLLCHGASRQAGEPVFNVSASHDWQRFQDVCPDPFQNPAVVHAICLTLAYAVNGGRMNAECLLYRLRAVQEINVQLSDPIQAVSSSVMTTVLLLAGIDARDGDAASAQAHLGGMVQIMQVCDEQRSPLGHALKRAMYWQDLFCAVIARTSRVFSHETFAGTRTSELGWKGQCADHTSKPSSELHWHREPHSSHLYDMPQGFHKYRLAFNATLLQICGDVCALQRQRDRHEESAINSVAIMHLDNQQASIESRIQLYLETTSCPLKRSIALALYICAYILFADIWTNSLIPSHLSGLLLDELKACSNWQVWKGNRDLLLWLCVLGASFNRQQDIRPKYAALWTSICKMNDLQPSLSWVDAQDRLKDFIWSDRVFSKPCADFWENHVLLTHAQEP